MPQPGWLSALISRWTASGGEAGSGLNAKNGVDCVDGATLKIRHPVSWRDGWADSLHMIEEATFSGFFLVG